MKAWLAKNKKPIATIATLAAGAGATYFGGPMAGDAAREYAPVILGALASMFGL